MKYKLMQFVSIIVIATFAWPRPLERTWRGRQDLVLLRVSGYSKKIAYGGQAWGRPGQNDWLRPRAAGERFNSDGCSSTNISFKKTEPLIYKQRGQKTDTFDFLPRDSTFVISRYSSQSFGPIAYIATYPDRKGRICLRYGVKTKKGLTVPASFYLQLDGLKAQCGDRIHQDKRFDPRSFNQANVMLSGAVFQQELIQSLKRPLPAFINTIEHLSRFGEINEGNLQGVLVGFGYKVSYINSCYKIYTYWRDKGKDVAVLYEFSGYDRDEFRRVLDEIGGLGLPAGRFFLPASFYLHQVLISLDKFERRPPVSLTLLSEALVSFISYRRKRSPGPEDLAAITEELALVRGIAGDEIVDEALKLLSQGSLTESEVQRLGAIISELRSAVNSKHKGVIADVASKELLSSILRPLAEGEGESRLAGAAKLGKEGRPLAAGDRDAPEGAPSSDPEYEKLIRLHAELFCQASYLEAKLEFEKEKGRTESFGSVDLTALAETKRKFAEADNRAHDVHIRLRQRGASLGKSPLEIAGDVLISIIRLMPAFQERIWPSYSYALIRSRSPDTVFSIYGGFYAYELDARKDILLAFYNNFWDIDSYLYSSGDMPPETRQFKSKAEKALKEVDRFIDFLKRNKPAILPFIKIVDYKNSHRHEGAPNIFGIFVVGIAFPVKNLEDVLSALKEFLIEKAGEGTILPAKPDGPQEALLSSI